MASEPVARRVDCGDDRALRRRERRRVHAGAVRLVQPYDEITLADVVTGAMVRERVTATLLTALSVLAVVLLAIGVFGLMSALVSERSREMAIRMALGASPRRIARHVLSYAARIVAVAILVGLPIAWASAHAIESLLYGVTPSSLTAYVWGLVAIVAAALLAALGPVRRAARIDPLAVMRGS